MINLYYWTTPNGHKITIFLEEANLPYQIFPIDINKGEQHTPEFLQISPNNKIPAIVDKNPADGGKFIRLFESGAILLYLAEKTGQFIATDVRTRAEILQWLFWQVGGLGPMAGQSYHFSHYAPEKIAYAIERYNKETARLFGVLNQHLADREFIARDYSIADIACYPWVAFHGSQHKNLPDFPHLQRWVKTIKARPAVQRAYAKADEIIAQTVTSTTDQSVTGQGACGVKQ